MYLKDVQITDFRSCESLSVAFRPDITILAGENNGGKSNVLEALRLVTVPLSLRRERYPEEEDIRRGLGAVGFTIAATFADLTPAQHARMMTAWVDSEGREARFGMTFGDATGGRRSSTRRASYWTGAYDGQDSEPEVREYVRHVHFPALRDAQRALSSGSTGRIASLIVDLTPDEDARLEFVRAARASLGTLQKHSVVQGVQDRVGQDLTALTRGVRGQVSKLGFSATDIARLARDMKFLLSNEGLEPVDLAESGLGYANLLYIASIMVQLEVAKDVELTLLLLEEPEAHLHPQLQSVMLNYLKEKCTPDPEEYDRGVQPARHIQVIATTHSPNLAAGISVDRLVLLRLAKDTLPDDEEAERPPGGQLASDREAVPQMPAGEPRSPENEQHPRADRPAEAGLGEAAKPRVVYRSTAIAVANLGMASKQLAKVDRYLNATRSSLLFSDRVVLVEGIAEALLLPALARYAKAVGILDDVSLTRFLGAALVPIDGVDFTPYLDILLSQDGDARVASRVVVVTDTDPASPGDAKIRLEEYVHRLDAIDTCLVFVSDVTLEHDLWDAGNGDLLTGTIREMHPMMDLDALESSNVAQPVRGIDFLQFMNDHRIRKGDLAQRVAQSLEIPETRFNIPPYLLNAICAVEG